MTDVLEVLEAGLSTTVQDLGRPGHQALGVPVSGALDAEAHRIANALVGNPEGAAAIEIRMLGPTLRVSADAVRMALAGSDGPLEVLGDAPRRVASWQSVVLRRGETLRVGALRGSATATLAVAGGIAVPEVLGSRSTYARGGFGGLCGRRLAAGDRLPLAPGAAGEGPELGLGGQTPPVPPGRIRVVPGPQDDHFTGAALAAFFGQPFEITREADRMGYRLRGPRLEHARGFNIVSDGIAPGSIQVPGDGQPILLLADRQTTGGYPKVATVVSADLPAVGRMSPGQSIRFEAVGIEAATALRRGQEAAIRRLIGGLAPIRRDPSGLRSSFLLSVNLVAGLVNAREPDGD